MNDEVAFAPPGHTAIVGRRFEHFYCPEYRCWVVIDRMDGALTKCMDRGAAAERAGLLESIRQLLFATEVQS